MPGTFAAGDQWVPSGRALYTNPGSMFYQPSGYLDAFGHQTDLTYDDYFLLVEMVTDPLDNVITVESDYRTLAPWKITDPNDNGSMVAFDALGQVVGLAAFGDGGEGDTLAKSTARYEYTLNAWSSNAGPNWARARLKENHGDHENYPLDSYTYVDGFGRTVLTKATVADGPAWALGGGGNYSWDAAVSTRWLGSGRVVYDNKGNPKKQYEPYFSRSSGFEDADKLAAFGVTPVLHRPAGTRPSSRRSTSTARTAALAAPLTTSSGGCSASSTRPARSPTPTTSGATSPRARASSSRTSAIGPP